MSRRIIFIYIVSMLVPSCSIFTGTNLGKNEKEALTPGRAIDLWKINEPTDTALIISGYIGTLWLNGEQLEKFRGYIRINGPSSMIITFANMAGMEGGRLIMKDGVYHAINRIEKNYQAGKEADGASLMGIPLNGNIFTMAMLCKWSWHVQKNGMDPVPADLEHGNQVYSYFLKRDALLGGSTRIHIDEAEGRVKRVENQRINGERIIFLYESFALFGGKYYPEILSVEYITNNSSTKIEIEVKKRREWSYSEIKVKIPENYREIERQLP